MSKKVSKGQTSFLSELNDSLTEKIQANTDAIDNLNILKGSNYSSLDDLISFGSSDVPINGCGECLVNSSVTSELTNNASSTTGKCLVFRSSGVIDILLLAGTGASNVGVYFVRYSTSSSAISFSMKCTLTSTN